ncbi:SMI1/KNR4 family protein [Roseburia sp. 1XD42-69]|uniref:SMI1/KNR4 family protein n=1 Tax=Bacteroides congonensis TaxID=1871006 RepID=UPI002ED4B925
MWNKNWVTSYQLLIFANEAAKLRLSSQFMIEEWGYPAIGVAICDTPTAGHDMVFLDYRECGPQGEPKVVHIAQEFDYEVTFLANNFEEFIRGLMNEDDFEFEE